MNPENLNPRNYVNEARRELKRMSEELESAAGTCKLLSQHPKLTPGLLRSQFLVLKAQLNAAASNMDSVTNRINAAE